MPCLLWAFLPGLCNLDVVYELLYSYDWEGGYSFASWGMAVLRLALVNFPGLIALYWLWWPGEAGTPPRCRGRSAQN